MAIILLGSGAGRGCWWLLDHVVRSGVRTQPIVWVTSQHSLATHCTYSQGVSTLWWLPPQKQERLCRLSTQGGRATVRQPSQHMDCGQTAGETKHIIYFEVRSLNALGGFQRLLLPKRLCSSKRPQLMHDVHEGTERRRWLCSVCHGSQLDSNKVGYDLLGQLLLPCCLSSKWDCFA